MTLIRSGEVDPNTVRPGWIALLVVLALAAATFLLWRSMGKQLKKIDFDEDATTAPPEPESPYDDALAPRPKKTDEQPPDGKAPDTDSN